MDNLLNGLNEPQKKAVETTEGPVMVIAGAGSGKTNVLTRRVAYLIDQLGVPKMNILAITFTNKAAEEMRFRIGNLLGIPTRGMWISTFHSMCARMLREHIEYLDYSRDFQIIDDDDSTQLVKIIMRDLDIDPKLIKPSKMKNHVLHVKRDPTLLDEYQEPLATYLNKVYPAYQRRLKNNNLLDFDDLLLLTIKILKQEPAVREFYHRQFEYVMVDEFQDTNDLQYQLISLLSNEKGNVFIVGDEDQSIYAFRGANIENLRKFKRDFRQPKLIVLEQNYRSTNTILKAANQVIASNKNRIEKNLYSTKDEGKKIRYFKGMSERDEADYVVEKIQELLAKGYTYEDFGILYRTNNTSRIFEEAFMKRRIPYVIVGNTSFFKRKEIKDIVAYLRLLLNVDDDYSFQRVINEPKRGIGRKTVERLRAHATKEELSLFRAIDDAKTPLTGRALKNLKAFKKMIEGLITQLFKTDFNTFLDDLLETTGYKEALKKDEKGDVRYENILELKTMLKESEKTYDTEDKKTILIYTLEDIALKSQEDDITDEDAVTLMTMHAAKGLEFPVVFIVALEHGLFPLYRSLDNPKDLEEERRLMYVAVTRAQDQLFLTNAKQRYLYGEMTQNTDSVFIREIDSELIAPEGYAMPGGRHPSSRFTNSRKEVVERNRRALNNYKQNDLNKGDKVIHKTFGEGVVISVASNQCTVAFSKEHGLKTLMKDHPSIRKKEKQV
ncbi:MAG: ATP-dependent helicase [Bacillota bacterium]